MPSIPTIPANPTIIPPTQEKIYDKWHISNIKIISDDPNIPIVVIAKLEKYCYLENGLLELSPIDPPVFIRIDDVFEKAATDSDLATIMVLILNYMAREIQLLTTTPEPEPEPEETPEEPEENIE